MDIKKLQKRLEKFAKDRDWEQFHNPKNLSMALSVEVAELVEIFQWSNSGGLDEIKDLDKRKKIEEEVADIFVAQQWIPVLKIHINFTSRTNCNVTNLLS